MATVTTRDCVKIQLTSPSSSSTHWQLLSKQQKDPDTKTRNRMKEKKTGKREKFIIRLKDEIDHLYNTKIEDEVLQTRSKRSTSSLVKFLSEIMKTFMGVF